MHTHTYTSLPCTYVPFWILQIQQPPMSLSPALPWFVKVHQDQSPWTSLVSGHICSVQGELMISLRKLSLCPLPQQKETLVRWSPETHAGMSSHVTALRVYSINEKPNLCLYLIEEGAGISTRYIYFRYVSAHDSRRITIHIKRQKH